MLANDSTTALRLLRQTGSRTSGDFAEPGPGSSPELDEFSGGEQIVCRRCGERITSAGQRIEVNGKHEHMFTNPEGTVFHIGCFARVRGCVFAGQPTGEWSWFKGYQWRTTYCAQCNVHPGWSYELGSDVFYGLVLRSIIIVS